MEVSPVKRVSVSEQIFEQLKEKITSGELQPGEKLPSENELCKLYGVSRTTIRQALANLSSLDGKGVAAKAGVELLSLKSNKDNCLG